MSKAADWIVVISVAVEEIRHYAGRPLKSVDFGQRRRVLPARHVGEDYTERGV